MPSMILEAPQFRLPQKTAPWRSSLARQGCFTPTCKAVESQYELEKLPGRPPPPPPPPPPPSDQSQGGRRSLLVAAGSLVAGVGVARWLIPTEDGSSTGTRQVGAAGEGANPWADAWREARNSDVMDRDGLLSVRRSSGEWLFLQQGPNPKAFTLEGEFGERYMLQTDKNVASLSQDALRTIFSRHDLWEPRLQPIK